MDHENRAALSVERNQAGRWEWVLMFSDDVTLPSRRVCDEDFATEAEALAAGQAARRQFAGRSG